MSGFQNLVRMIANGDPVDEATINSVLATLDANTRYVLDLVRTALMGQALFAREVSLAPGTFVGGVVYWDARRSLFDNAIAATDTDPATGDVIVAVTSRPWGVVYRKHNSTRGDLLILGKASLDIAGAIVDGQLEAGVYYLSGLFPGKLTRQEPPVSIPVLYSDGQGQVFVVPNIHNPILDHRHYRYELKCVPAGDHVPPPPGDRHQITNPRTDLEGWLPADHAIFNQKAPPGAKFGYNLFASPSLRRVWPPLPVSSAYLEWDRGELSHLGFMGVPLGSSGLAIVDANGIWWMSDCYGDVPWPNETFSGGESGSSSSQSSLGICPRPLQMRMGIYFTRMLFQSRGTVVNSLQVAGGSESLLFVRCRDGSQGSTGHLEIGLSLPQGVEDDLENFSPLAFKSVLNSGWKRGPVVSSIRSDSSALEVSGVSAGDKYFGEVTIRLLNAALGREIPIELVQLQGVTEESFEGAIALGFPPRRSSSFRGKVSIPLQLDGSTIKVQFQFWVMGSVDGQLPDLRLSYRRLPAATATPQPLPRFDSDLALASLPSVAAWNYVKVTSDLLTVSPGEVLYFSVYRRGMALDGYAGEVHIVDRRLVIKEVS